jgi:hypothetical protein
VGRGFGLVEAFKPVFLQIDPEALQPLLDAAVDRALARMDEIRAKLGDKLAYSEAAASALLSLEEHVLRDARRRKEIRAYVTVGGRVRYLREDLVDFITKREWSQETQRRSGWPAGRPRPERNGAAAAERHGGMKDKRRR